MSEPPGEASPASQEGPVSGAPDELVRNLLSQLSVDLPDGVPSDPRALLTAAIQFQSWGGPLPPPEMLRQYEQVVPGFGESLLEMAQRQEAHRQHLERIVVEGGSRRASQGLWVGAALSVILIVFAFILGLRHDQVAASVLGSVDVVGLATVFVVGKREQRHERLEKTQAMKSAVKPPGT